MTVASQLKPIEPEEPARPPAVRLEESLRDLVHEEMGVVRASAQKQTPSRSDAFWLFLCVADAALFLWLLPDEKLSDKRVELLFKLVTLLGGSLFVLGYVWFRDLFLAYVRHLWFKITLVALPFLLVPIYVTGMDIFPIAPEIEPRNAELEIDGVTRQKNNLKVSLRSHKVIVRVKSPNDQDTPTERPFPLSPGAIWRSWRNNEQPHWPVDFPVPVNFSEEGPETVELIKEDGKFDPEFRGSRPQMLVTKRGEITPHLGDWKGDAILFTWPYPPGQVAIINLKLPYGSYRLTAHFADKVGCEKSAFADIAVNASVKLKDVARICK